MIKYEYLVFTWGGFYNKEYRKLHKQKPGNRWFDTKEDADSYINFLKELEERYDARHLAISREEGYNTRKKTICHRVVEVDGKMYESTYDLGYAYPIDSAVYWCIWKWYPGCNDYVAIQDSDKDLDKIENENVWVEYADENGTICLKDISVEVNKRN